MLKKGESVVCIVDSLTFFTYGKSYVLLEDMRFFGFESCPKILLEDDLTGRCWYKIDDLNFSIEESERYFMPVSIWRSERLEYLLMK